MTNAVPPLVREGRARSVVTDGASPAPSSSPRNSAGRWRLGILPVSPRSHGWMVGLAVTHFASRQNRGRDPACRMPGDAGPVVGLGLIQLLNQREWPWLVYLYDRTILAPCLASDIRCCHYTAVLWHGLRSLPQDLVDAAKLDGVGAIGMVTHLIVPLRGQHFLIRLARGLDHRDGRLATSILVLPPGSRVPGHADFSAWCTTVSKTNWLPCACAQSVSSRCSPRRHPRVSSIRIWIARRRV